MRTAVLGASGRTGLQVVRHALARGDEVTAVVRDPEKFRRAWPRTPGPDLRQADARDAPSLTAALAGQDAVAFCLGQVGTGPHTIQADGMRACLAAMRTAGVRRLVVLSASGLASDGDDLLTRRLVKPLVQRVLREPFADLRAMEDLVTASDTDWTVVRPPRLTDATGQGHYRSCSDGNVRGGFSISRDDLALAMVDALHDHGRIGALLSVAR